MTTNLFKTFVACASLFAGCLSGNAAKVLMVTGADGGETVLAFSEAPKVTVGADALVVTAGSRRVEYPVTDVVKFVVEDREPGSAVSAEVGAVAFVVNDGSVSASGLEPGSAIAAYGVDGREIGYAVADEQGCASVDLSAANGVVIIKTDTKVLKLKK